MESPPSANLRRSLRKAAAFAMAVCVFTAGEGVAEDLPGTAPPQSESSQAENPVDLHTNDTLDSLFTALKKAPSSEAAKAVNHAIQVRWLHSGSATVDLLMQRALEAMNSKDFPLSLDLLDAVVDLKPDFAEGWNRRATVYYLTEDFGRSIGDIEQTLKLEPRHFGALSGLANIFRRLGKDADALDVYEKTLEINPRLESVQKAYQELLEKIDGRDI